MFVIYFALLSLSLNMLIFFYVGAIFSLISVRLPTFYINSSFFHQLLFGRTFLDDLISLASCSLNLPTTPQWWGKEKQCRVGRGGCQREAISWSLLLSVLWGLPLRVRRHLMQFKYCVSFLQTKHLCSY